MTFFLLRASFFMGMVRALRLAWNFLKKVVMFSRIITAEFAVLHVWPSIWYGAKPPSSSTLRLSHVQYTMGTRGIISVVWFRAFEIELEAGIKQNWMSPSENSFGPCPYLTLLRYRLSRSHLRMCGDPYHTYSLSTIWGSTRATAHMQLDDPVGSQISQSGRRRAGTDGASPTSAVAWAT